MGYSIGADNVCDHNTVFSFGYEFIMLPSRSGTNLCLKRNDLGLELATCLCENTDMLWKYDSKHVFSRSLYCLRKDTAKNTLVLVNMETHPNDCSDFAQDPVRA